MASPPWFLVEAEAGAEVAEPVPSPEVAEEEAGCSIFPPTLVLLNPIKSHKKVKIGKRAIRRTTKMKLTRVAKTMVLAVAWEPEEPEILST